MSIFRNILFVLCQKRPNKKILVESISIGPNFAFLGGRTPFKGPSNTKLIGQKAPPESALDNKVTFFRSMRSELGQQLGGIMI